MGRYGLLTADERTWKREQLGARQWVLRRSQGWVKGSKFTHHSFIHSFSYSFAHSCVYSFMHSFSCSFIPHSFIHWLTHSFMHSFLCSFIPHSFIHWLTHSFMHLFTHCLAHTFIPPVLHSPNHSLNQWAPTLFLALVTVLWHDGKYSKVIYPPDTYHHGDPRMLSIFA